MVFLYKKTCIVNNAYEKGKEALCFYGRKDNKSLEKNQNFEALDGEIIIFD